MTDFRPGGQGQPAAKRRRLSRGGRSLGRWRFGRLLSRTRHLRPQRPDKDPQQLESREIRMHARTQLRRMASTITMNAVFDPEPHSIGIRPPIERESID
jgi:hypothetical protein